MKNVNLSIETASVAIVEQGSKVILQPKEIGGLLIEGKSNTTIVQPQSASSAVITAQGPQGPQGPVGPAGGAGATYVYQQVSPSTSWVVNHNLGFKPSVELLDTGSQEIEGDVVHASVNQAIITMSPPTAGTARFT
jgi:hypothetical protein